MVSSAVTKTLEGISTSPRMTHFQNGKPQKLFCFRHVKTIQNLSRKVRKTS